MFAVCMTRGIKESGFSHKDVAGVTIFRWRINPRWGSEEMDRNCGCDTVRESELLALRIPSTTCHS